MNSCDRWARVVNVPHDPVAYKGRDRPENEPSTAQRTPDGRPSSRAVVLRLGGTQYPMPPFTEIIPLIAIVLQTVTSLSIAGGLLFGAYQFASARKAQRVANFTKMVELQMALRRMRVENPALASVYRDDVRNLQSDEDIRFYFFNLMQLSLLEIAWYSHKHGQLTDAYFESWAKRFRVIAAEPSFRKMMANPSMKIMDDEFQLYVNQLLRETEDLAVRVGAPASSAAGARA